MRNEPVLNEFCFIWRKWSFLILFFSRFHFFFFVSSKETVTLFLRGIRKSGLLQMGKPRPKTVHDYPGGFRAELTRGEALQILGVKEGTDPKQITLAYQKLMMRNHPDSGMTKLLWKSWGNLKGIGLAGGSTYIATKINEAKVLVLGA